MKEERNSFPFPLDWVAAACCFVGGVIILVLSFTIGFGQYGMGAAFITAPLLYAVFRRAEERQLPEPSFRLYKVASAVFFLFLAASTAVYLEEPYSRPLFYFALITLAFGTIIIDIHYINDQGRLASLALGKLVVASLAFRAGRFYILESIPGNDTQFHLRLANIITETGSLPSFSVFQSKYVFTPIWHSSISISQLVTDVGSADALFLGAAVPFAIITILAGYSIGYRLTGDIQVGLLGGLFASTADMLLVRGVTAIYTSSFVICYFALVLVLMYADRSRQRSSAAIMLLLLVAVFTHQLSTFVVLLVLSIMMVSQYLVGSNNRFAVRKSAISPALVGVFGLSIYVQWSRAQNTDLTFFEAIVLRALYAVRGLSVGSSGAGYAEGLASYGAVSNILYNLGYTLLLGVAMLGLLLWLQREEFTVDRFSLVAAVGALFVMIYPLTLAGFGQMLLPHRQMVYLVFLLCILGGVGTKALFQYSARPTQTAIVGLLVIGVVFAMLTTPFVNRDNPVYADNRVDRTELTEAEVSSILWVTKTAPEDRSITIDPQIIDRMVMTERYRSGLRQEEYYGGVDAPKDDIRNFGDEGAMEGAVVYRSAVSSHEHMVATNTFGDTEFIRTSVIEAELAERNRVYDSDGASVYVPI